MKSARTGAVRGRGSSQRRFELKWGLIFISPWVLGFFIFFLVPMVSSLGFSLFDFNLSAVGAHKFIGLENWKRAVLKDTEVPLAVLKTFAFAGISLPISFLFALTLALVLNSSLLRGKSFFRALFYLPAMIPFVGTVMIWYGVLNQHAGWINQIIESVTGFKATGSNGIQWLQSVNLVYLSFTWIGLWGIGNMVMTFIAGLQKVPTELYEAATVDGAGWGTRLTRITLPMITPIIFYNLILAIIGTMQFFLVPYVINRGDGTPAGMTNFIMVYFYRQSFNYFNMGYGAVIAWIIFIIAMLFTVVLFTTQKRWVYYMGEK
ncbi:MAG: sugar ABC transporter permease [Spirochaetia bacterium]|jgi:multiple sugar transport system permease protein